MQLYFSDKHFSRGWGCKSYSVTELKRPHEELTACAAFPEEKSFSTLCQASPQTTGQQCTARLERLSQIDPRKSPGSNWNSSQMPSQADWVKLIIFSCRNESISSAQQLSISTLATHLIQLNFTQALFIADSLDVTTDSFKQINFIFAWNLLCPPCCGQCWLPDGGEWMTWKTSWPLQHFALSTLKTPNSTCPSLQE